MEAHWLTPPKKFRTQPSACKVMATVCYAKGIILIDYRHAGVSITGEYYVTVIKQLEKRRRKLPAGVLHFHDNTHVHKSRFVQEAIRECKFEQLNHPPYTPDLVPSD